MAFHHLASSEPIQRTTIRCSNQSPLLSLRMSIALTTQMDSQPRYFPLLSRLPNDHFLTLLFRAFPLPSQPTNNSLPRHHLALRLVSIGIRPHHPAILRSLPFLLHAIVRRQVMATTTKMRTTGAEAGVEAEGAEAEEEGAEAEAVHLVVALHFHRFPPPEVAGVQ